MDLNYRLEDSLDLTKEQLVEKLKFGKALIFTGAGFSADMLNIDGKKLPLSGELAEEICKLGGFEIDRDLAYATDRYISNDDSHKITLINFLKNKLTVKTVQDEHREIAGFDWHRCYTTNYDNGFSKAALEKNKIVDDIELMDSIERIYESKNQSCIHINGQLTSLKKDYFESNLKLTSSSYLSKEDFFSSKWFSFFKKDLEDSSAIIFIGYSLYDEFIKKILFWDSSSFKEKTFFITRENIAESAKYKFKKYGRILNIEVKGFAEILKNNKDNINYTLLHENNKSIIPCNSPVGINRNIPSDKKLEELFLYGKYDFSSIYSFVLNKRDGNSSFDNFIYRFNLIKKAINLIENGQNLFILSELGNGKSIFLELLKSYILIHKQYDLYSFNEDFSDNFYKELECLIKNERKSLIFFDGYYKNIEYINCILNANASNVKFIVSGRTIEFDNYRNEYTGKISSLSLDFLEEDDLYTIIDIVNTLGLLVNDVFIHNKPREKVEYLKDKCNAQLSSILLDIFNSDNIKNKIKEILDDFRTTEERDALFIICFLSIYGGSNENRIKKHIISDFSSNQNLIYSNNFVGRESFKTLFKNNPTDIEVSSSLFCLSVIRNYFDATYITNKLLDIAVLLDKQANIIDPDRRLLKTVLKYSTIERLLPQKLKIESLRGYYDSLKKKISWLVKDPHFWLQYAMCQISLGEYDKA